MPTSVLAAFLAPMCVACMACSSAQATCNSSFTVQPHFVVTNEATSQPICDATILAAAEADASVAQPDQLIDSGTGCEYSTLLLPGSDTVVVSAPGFQTTTVTVVVQTVPCWDTSPAASPTVQVRLTPS